MSINVRDFKVLSSDGVHRLAGLIYEPEGEVKGYFHVVHGMTDHIHRYAPIMRDMAELGFICFGYDHIGHGYTANDDSELGYIAKTDGWDLLCRDVKVFSDAVKAEYGADVPYVLMGHSMGSFIVRLAATRYRDIADKLIICGTAGSNPVASVGIALARILAKIKGSRAYSPLIESMAFGSYNKYFEGDTPYEWLTKDKEAIAKYQADKFCNYHFTISALADLITLTYKCNLNTWYIDMPKKLPILLVSGADDPVGNYGKGVREVYNKLKKSGAEDVTIHLYENFRHEIHNDSCKEESRNDILEFIVK